MTNTSSATRKIRTRLLDGVLGIPEHNDVESLGVAGAGAVASFELARRRHR